ncbi:MAG: YbhB/YbcL family Raf kinase inhibitor-like protein [Actinomycetota bacterium]
MPGSRLLAAAVLLTLAVACGEDEPSGVISPVPENLDEFELSSPAFEDGGPIPEEFSCDGDDLSPPIEWSGVPDGTAELLLTLVDPDTPSGVFTHWSVFSMDPSSDGAPQDAVPEGALQGTNDFGEASYGGPCPPEGQAHTYIFTLAALPEPSGLASGASPSEVDSALQRAVATTTLTGTYPA